MLLCRCLCKCIERKLHSSVVSFVRLLMIALLALVGSTGDSRDNLRTLKSQSNSFFENYLSCDSFMTAAMFIAPKSLICVWFREDRYLSHSARRVLVLCLRTRVGNRPRHE